ncbi:MAG: hypothetical protein ACR2RE_00280 [Geminicoccaceae bacterium]
MELANFVEEVLKQISKGVSETQTYLTNEGSSAQINPPISRERDGVIIVGPLEITVDFKVYICADGRSIAERHDGVKRPIRFTVPMILPTPSPK